MKIADITQEFVMQDLQISAMVLLAVIGVAVILKILAENKTPEPTASTPNPAPKIKKAASHPRRKGNGIKGAIERLSPSQSIFLENIDKRNARWAYWKLRRDNRVTWPVRITNAEVDGKTGCIVTNISRPRNKATMEDCT